MNPSMPLENQLLVTKFSIPVKSGSLISRPRLTRLLDESLKYSLTLVSAAAGFGKTTLLASWSQSFPSNTPRVAWVSLDEEDNEPRLFWTYVLTALDRQVPERFTSLLLLSQSPQPPPLNSLLAMLINVLAEGREHFALNPGRLSPDHRAPGAYDPDVSDRASSSPIADHHRHAD